MITRAAPAFHNLFMVMGCVFDINTVHKTVEKLLLLSLSLLLLLLLLWHRSFNVPLSSYILQCGVCTLALSVCSDLHFYILVTFFSICAFGMESIILEIY